jgi:hypothetical protein
MSRASFTNNRSASRRDGPAQPHSAILQFSLSLALRRGNNGIKFMRPSTILTESACAQLREHDPDFTLGSLIP